MSEAAFRDGFDALMKFEGSTLSLDPDDPGNWTGGSVGDGELRGTKYGIDSAMHPELDVAELTLDRARELFRAEWWERAGWSRLPDAIGAKMLAVGPDVGSHDANVCLQRALRTCGRALAEDGAIGPATAAAAGAAPILPLLAALRSEFACHYRLVLAAKPALEKFRAGWLARAYA
jgi:lysozyme family protein